MMGDLVYNPAYGNMGVDEPIWNSANSLERQGIYDGWNGLAASSLGKTPISTGNQPWYENFYKNDKGNFDYGQTIGNIGSTIGLAGGLMDMFGLSPGFKEGKRINDANIKNQKRMAKNSETAYNNQLARGASARARANGGTDPLSRVG